VRNYVGSVVGLCTELPPVSVEPADSSARMRMNAVIMRIEGMGRKLCQKDLRITINSGVGRDISRHGFH